MGRRWKPSRAAAKKFAITMQEIDKFIEENGIKASASRDSYYFTVNGIPSNATINGTTCSLRARVTGTGSSYTGSTQLYSNSTVKGSSVSINQTGTNGVVYTISDAEFTLSELSNIYLNILHPLGGNNRYVYFYGATLTIDYTWYETAYSISISSNVQGVGQQCGCYVEPC